MCLWLHLLVVLDIEWDYDVFKIIIQSRSLYGKCNAPITFMLMGGSILVITVSCYGTDDASSILGALPKLRGQEHTW